MLSWVLLHGDPEGSYEVVMNINLQLFAFTSRRETGFLNLFIVCFDFNEEEFFS